ncbi:MAG: hypothetical protein AAFV80_21810 [Bacteroidota bacterium]
MHRSYASYTAILLVLLVFPSCLQEGQFFQPKKNLLGVWIGESQEYYGSKGPLPILLDFKADGTVFIQNLKEEGKRESWSLSAGQLTVDTTKFTIFELSAERLRFGINSVQSFKRVSEEQLDQDLESIKTTLQDGTFKNQHGGLLKFGESALFTYQEMKTEKRCYDLFEYDGYAFIYQFGDLDTCNQNQIGGIHQFLDFSDIGFTLLSAQADELFQYQVAESELVSSFFEPKPLKFQTCGFGDLYPHGAIIDAHEQGGKFVENYFFEQVDLDLSPVVDGFFILKFTINCRGEVGGCSYEGLDRNYQSIEFPSFLQTRIFNALESLDGWLPLESNGAYFDSYKSIVFRFDKGQLIAVSP